MAEFQNKDFSILGENLKNIRSKMNLSLNDVSVMTGVSKTMLSQIECSKSVPTISTVWKIANGLKVKFDSLLLDNSSNQYEVKSIENLTPLTDDNGHMLIYCLYPFSPLNGMELYYAIIKPGCDYTSEMHKNSNHASTEYLMVAIGEVELVVGANIYSLRAGSAISFNAREKHIYRNKCSSDAIVHFIHYFE